MLFTHPEFADHEQVVFVCDPEPGLKAIIAIHSTRRGPALGGCRCWNYQDEEEALTDVLRLSRGMTYKAALANVDLGGGKSVILLAPGQKKTPDLIRAMGLAIDELGGAYITGEDIGTDVGDMGEFRRVTQFVQGYPVEMGGSGDPSPMTALGVFVGIEACVRHRLGLTSLSGLRVIVQGVGNVGGNLCRLLHEAGVHLIVSDVNTNRLAKMTSAYGAQVVGADDVYATEADVYAPCAFGAALNDETIPRLRVAIVAGAANNQLSRPEHGMALRRRNILYAPDYVINGGGLIQLAIERTGYDGIAAERRVRGIAETLREIFRAADAGDVSTQLAADRIAEKRIAAAPLPGTEVRRRAP